MNCESTPVHFVAGLELAESFFREAVAPIIDGHYPALAYTAALIGPGSEVLGFDTEMSTDHHWGPRAMLFLRPSDFERLQSDLRTTLADELPTTFHGYSTNFSPPDPDDNGTQVLCPVDSGPINHRVEMFTLKGFFHDYLNIEIDEQIEPADWLTLPNQKLRSICAGAVFRDDLGLAAIRQQLSWYPDDLWLYMLASGWSRIGEEEHLMGRAGCVGDQIGSSLIASRLVRDIMRLAFLMEREYPPYPKWFGTAFRQLQCARELEPVLTAVLNTSHWQEHESNLCMAYSVVARMHNRLQITEPLPETACQFWGRPFRVIQGCAFASALKERIKDPAVQLIATLPLIGNVDLVSDCTDLLEDEARRLNFKELYAGNETL